MKFYEIDEAIMNCVDAETGEIVDAEKLEALEMERSQKIESIACWIKQLKAEAAAIKAEKMQLAYRQQVKERKADSLTEFLNDYLGGEKFETAKCSISYRKSERIIFQGNPQIPDDYITSIEKKWDRERLKKDIKAGMHLIGVNIETVNNIQIK